MSRRSLPLNESLLDGALTSSLNVGRGRSWSRLQRSGPVQRHSASCSESLLLGSPRRHTRQPVHNSSLHSMVTDTSLMSSLLEESSIQDSTMINTMWGLDQDGDPKENSMSEETCSRQRTQLCSKLFCRECIPQPAARPSPTAATLHPEPSAVCQDRNRGSCTAHQCRGLCRRWSQLTSRLHLTQFSLTLSWVLLPLLLLLSLGWFCFASFHLLLTYVNISAWTSTAAVSNTQDSSLSNSFFASQSWSAGDASEAPKEAGEEQLLEGPAERPAQKLSDAERLLHVEQSLAALWKLVEAKGQRADQLQSKVSWYHSQLQQQPPSQREVELWLKRRLDRELMELHRKLNEERELRKQDRLQQQKHTSRLDQMEQQLQTLAYQIQELQSTLETSTRNPPSAAVSLGASSFHDALFAKVSQLEAAVGDIFQDMAHVSKRWDGCQQLGKIQQMISKQVSKLVGEEVRALVSGNQLTYRDAVTLPEVLLTWLSQQFVSSSHLEAALLSLELSILQNVSLQLQQFEEMVGGAAPPGGGRPATKEDVQVMLRDALRRFSEDRTGMADYALESAGGSILSTRCSETYETRAALLSMFGVPLWYFSQSPRTVIQPDVHPGNCWAFRGSTGFLVIRLSMSILPTAFTLEHIPKALTPSGMLLSAPRHFSVYGLTAENQEHGRLLGTFTYREDGEALQTFLVTEENKEFFQIIEVQVLSNWGHPDYTCMYRFRVHGTPTKEPGLH